MPTHFLHPYPGPPAYPPRLQGREILQSTVDLVQGSVGSEVRLGWLDQTRHRGACQTQLAWGDVDASPRRWHAPPLSHPLLIAPIPDPVGMG